MRSGFTLLELIVAIILTGVIALLVYGAAGAAVDTQARLAERARELRWRQAWRAVLQDALRNARPGAGIGDEAFVLEEGVDAQGRPADRLSFITAGSLPPLTPDADWQVTLQASEGRLVLLATPLGVQAPPRRIAAFQGITGVDIRVIDPLPGAEWRHGWRFKRLVPAGVEFTYWTDDGPVGPPLRLMLPLGYVQ